MNHQRRLLLKLMGATGLAGLVGWGIYRQQSSAPLTSAWLSATATNAQFKSLSEQWPDPYAALLQHLQLPAAVSEADAIQAARQQIRLDFKNQQIIQVNQWHLSQTEVLMVLSAIQLFGVAVAPVVAEKTLENAPLTDFLQVERWGPQETYQGVKFNEQPDGHCGLWVIADNVPDGLEVYIGGELTNHFPNERGFTTGIYSNVEAFINRVGATEIMVYDRINHRKQVIGSFQVLPAFEFHQYPDGQFSAVFSPIDNWGPIDATLGQAFNEQPNGYAAFWFRVSSMSNQVWVDFNGHQIKATVRKDLITASLPVSYLPTEPGAYPVKLSHRDSQETLLAGHIQINPPKE